MKEAQPELITSFPHGAVGTAPIGRKREVQGFSRLPKLCTHYLSNR